MNKEFNLQNFIISVVIIGVILVVGIYITSSIQATTRATGTAGSYVNESVTLSALGVGTLAANGYLDGSCGTITKVYNATSNAITSGNYTQSGCTVTNSTQSCAGTTCASPWKISYSYTFTNDTQSSIAAGNVTNALATGTSWISILVVVGFATIILTMLTSGLGQAAQQQGATPYY